MKGQIMELKPYLFCFAYRHGTMIKEPWHFGNTTRSLSHMPSPKVLEMFRRVMSRKLGVSETDFAITNVIELSKN